jgi:hypothetical protein
VTVWLLSIASAARADIPATGWVDGATTGALSTISGWARDDDSPNSIDVHIYIQLNGTGPLQFLTSSTANLCSEPAVGGIDTPDANGCRHHRFIIPYGALGTGHKLYAYAIGVDAGGALTGNNPPLGNSPTTVTNLPVARQTGIYAWDSDPDCPGKRAMLDVFVLDRTDPASPQWRYHTRGYTNVPQNPPNYYDFATYLPFKFPLPTSFAPGDILVRRTRRTSCTSDSWMNWDSSSNYTDYSPSYVDGDGNYRSYGRSITFETANYKVLADRNGGAIYEYYNKRLGDPLLPNNYENAVHANFGAAVQVSFHGDNSTLESQPCGSQGYWNPTQAGAACSSSPTVSYLAPQPGDSASGLSITCDGTVNNSCTSATNATWSEHTMMNWDYGPTYTGPYNAADTGKLTQTISAGDPAYLQVDVTLRNDPSSVDRPGLLEVPTFYFTNRFRSFFYPSSTGVVPTSPSFTFDALPGDIDAHNGGAGSGGCYDPGWITAQNTFDNTAAHPYITIAWFYKGTFLDMSNPPAQFCGGRYQFYVAEQPFWDTIKFTNTVEVPWTHGSSYAFRYVIFPFKYDETITTSAYGTHTVADTIALMRAAYR